MLSKKSAFFIAAILTTALSTVYFSCSENPEENKKSTEQRLTLVSGNNQSERVGMVLPDSLVVKAGDMLGNPSSGVLVHFSTTDSAAQVNPGAMVTGSDGIAKSCFRLGASAGSQSVMARTETDSTIFTETAVEPACSEENADKVCNWPAGHIFIATTSSSLLNGNGTVLLDFDPANPDDVTKIYETTDMLTDISFSSRGELFLATREKLMKIDPNTYQTEDFCTLNGNKEVSLDENPGGILAGLTREGPFTLLCPPDCATPFFSPGSFIYINWEDVAVSPITRDLYFITGNGPPSYTLWKVAWDGRTIPSLSDAAEYKHLSVSGAIPKGMCFDDECNLYISFAPNPDNRKSNYRRIVRIASDGTIDYSFFDFYAHGGNNAEGGMWGDITYADGKLYLLDTRNDRLVIISDSGLWLDSFSNNAFSMKFVENEKYSIAAAPGFVCP